MLPKSPAVKNVPNIERNAKEENAKRRDEYERFRRQFGDRKPGNAGKKEKTVQFRVASKQSSVWDGCWRTSLLLVPRREEEKEMRLSIDKV